MTRTDIINTFINKYNYTEYLEIGTQALKNFNFVQCSNKTGVDPRTQSKRYTPPDLGYCVTSDKFFSELPTSKKYDIIFIDGLHTHEQVEKDIFNSLQHLTENGTIVLHDCNPRTIESERVTFNGTCWRAFYEARKKYNIEGYVINTDHGCAVIRKSATQPPLPILDDSTLDFDFLYNNRVAVLNLISKEDFLQKINSSNIVLT